MSCVLSNKVLSPQNYLEKLTGDCFIINTCDDFKQIEKILYEKCMVASSDFLFKDKEYQMLLHRDLLWKEK